MQPITNRKSRRHTSRTTGGGNRATTRARGTVARGSGSRTLETKASSDNIRSANENWAKLKHGHFGDKASLAREQSIKWADVVEDVRCINDSLNSNIDSPRYDQDNYDAINSKEFRASEGTYGDLHMSLLSNFTGMSSRVSWVGASRRDIYHTRSIFSWAVIQFIIRVSTDQA